LPIPRPLGRINTSEEGLVGCANRAWLAAKLPTMHYFIHAKDRPDSLAARLAARPQHLARLQALCDQGRLLCAGPLPAIDAADPGPAGFTGSLIVAEFASLAAAREWADADPYLAAGVYAEVQVTPFRRVLP